MEEWRDVKDYIGLYQVSNLGNVKSLNYNRENKEKILKTGIDGWGYMYVALCKDNVRKNKKVHRLVAQHFLENPNNLEQVNHINGIKTDNRVCNLEFCTREHNMREAFKMGLVKRTKGGEHHLSKKVKQYDIQGNLIKEWACIRDIERNLGFAHTNISKCCKGKINAVYGYIWRYAEENFMEDKS